MSSFVMVVAPRMPSIWQHQYGIGACGVGSKLPGLRVEALPANTGVLTCLANDIVGENVCPSVRSKRK